MVASPGHFGPSLRQIARTAHALAIVFSISMRAPGDGVSVMRYSVVLPVVYERGGGVRRVHLHIIRINRLRIRYPMLCLLNRRFNFYFSVLVISFINTFSVITKLNFNLPRFEIFNPGVIGLYFMLKRVGNDGHGWVQVGRGPMLDSSVVNVAGFDFRFEYSFNEAISQR